MEIILNLNQTIFLGLVEVQDNFHYFLVEELVKVILKFVAPEENMKTWKSMIINTVEDGRLSLNLMIK